MTVYSVDIESGYIFRGNRLIARQGNRLLAKTIYYNENHVIAFLTGGHRLEVHGDVLPGVVRNRQELEKTRSLIAKYVGSVTGIVILNILFDIGQYTALVVAGVKKTVGLISF
jgi:hypothetical protein